MVLVMALVLLGLRRESEVTRDSDARSIKDRGLTESRTLWYRFHVVAVMIGWMWQWCRGCSCWGTGKDSSMATVAFNLYALQTQGSDQVDLWHTLGISLGWLAVPLCLPKKSQCNRNTLSWQCAWLAKLKTWARSPTPQAGRGGKSLYCYQQATGITANRNWKPNQKVLREFFPAHGKLPIISWFLLVCLFSFLFPKSQSPTT